MTTATAAAPAASLVPEGGASGKKIAETVDDAAPAPAPEESDGPKKAAPNRKGGDKAARRGRGPPRRQEEEEQEEEAPKRKLWVVRVPKPDDADTAAEGIATLEAKLSETSDRIGQLSTLVREKQEVRKAAQNRANAAREQLKDVGVEIREKIEQLKPLQAKLRAQQDDSKRAREVGKDVLVGSEAELDARVAQLEHAITHEVMPINEEKRIVQQIKKLQTQREAVRELERTRAVLNDGRADRDAIFSTVKTLKAEFDIVKSHEDAQRKLFEHFRAEERSADAELRKALTERAELMQVKADTFAELRSTRNALRRGESEYYRTRRLVWRVRELADRGEVAEAEALCCEQMERVHAKLNLDPSYREEYLRLLAKQTAEREARLEAQRSAAIAKAEEKAAAERIATERALAEAEATRAAAAAKQEAAAAAAEEAEAAAEAKAAEEAAAAEKRRREKKEAARKEAIAADAALSIIADEPMQKVAPVPTALLEARKAREQNLDEVVEVPALSGKELQRQRVMEGMQAAEERRKRAADKKAAAAKAKAARDAEETAKKQAKKELRKRTRAGASAEDLSASEAAAAAVEGLPAKATAPEQPEAEQPVTAPTAEAASKPQQSAAAALAATAKLPPAKAKKSVFKQYRSVVIAVLVLVAIIVLFFLVGGAKSPPPSPAELRKLAQQAAEQQQQQQQ